MDQALAHALATTAAEEAEAALRTALLAGEDTAAPRAALDVARVAAVALDTQQRAAHRDVSHAAREAADAVTQAANELRAAVGPDEGDARGEEIPAIDDSRVSAAAAEVARLQARAGSR